MSYLLDIQKNVKYTMYNFHRGTMMMSVNWINGNDYSPTKYVELSQYLPKRCFCWNLILANTPQAINKIFITAVCQIVYDKILREGL